LTTDWLEASNRIGKQKSRRLNGCAA
jgi:hypothetical protein